MFVRMTRTPAARRSIRRQQKKGLHLSGRVTALRQNGRGQERPAPRSAHEALRASATRYRPLFESQTDLISRYRPDTTLTFVNDAYYRSYGRTHDELLGRSYLLWVAPEFHEGVLAETRESAKVA